MSRDMRTIFGPDWSKKCGNGDRGVAGGRKFLRDVSGLVVPQHPKYLLQPSHKPIVLLPIVEDEIIVSLKEFETRFRTGIITATLIESVAMNEVLKYWEERGIGPGLSVNDMNDVIQSNLDKALGRIEKVKKGRMDERFSTPS